MAAIKISNIQDKDIDLELRQGNAFVLTIDYFAPDGVTPDDITGYTFFSQIRTDTADKSGTVIHTFSTTPDANGNKYVVTLLTARTEFFLSDELTRSLKPEKTYYFESKTRDAGGNPIDSVVLELKTKAEYARAS